MCKVWTKICFNKQIWSVSLFVCCGLFVCFPVSVSVSLLVYLLFCLFICLFEIFLQITVILRCEYLSWHCGLWLIGNAKRGHVFKALPWWTHSGEKQRQELLSEQTAISQVFKWKSSHLNLLWYRNCSVSAEHTFSKEAPLKPVIMEWFSLWNLPCVRATPPPSSTTMTRPSPDPSISNGSGRTASAAQLVSLSVGKMANLRLAGGREALA